MKALSTLRSSLRGLALPLLQQALLLAMAGTGVAAAECSVTPSPDWKATLTFPEDPFRRGFEWLVPSWTKFTILTCDPSTVYFQDSRKYAFHYDFATNHLEY